MSEAVRAQLSDINLKALLLSEEAGAVAKLFDNFAYQTELNPGAVMCDVDHEKGMYCLVRGMSKHFQTEFEKFAEEVEGVKASLWKEPKGKKIAKGVADGQERKA